MTANTSDKLPQSIAALTEAITGLEQREQNVLSLIQQQPPTNTIDLKKQYHALNTKKWDLIERIVALKKAETSKKVLQTMRNASKTIQSTLSYVNSVDTPSNKQQTLSAREFEALWTDIGHIISELKKSKIEVQFLHQIQHEWNDNKTQRDQIFPELIRTANDLNDDEKHFRRKIEATISKANSSLAKTCASLDTQRLAIVEAKGNVKMMEVISYSDLLYKLIWTESGSFSKADVDQEMNQIDDDINRLKQCMGVMQNIANELQGECATVDDKKVTLLIEKKMVSNAQKLNKLQRAMFTLQDIKMDNEIKQFLGTKMQQLENHVVNLNNAAERLRGEARQNAQAKQKMIALNVLKRKKLFELQRDEYKRKLSILRKSLAAISSRDDNYDNATGDNDNDEQKETSVQAVANDADEDTLNSDYTQWNSDDIVTWIVGLNGNKYSKYEAILREKMCEKNVHGSTLVMLNKTDLQSLGIVELDDAVEVANHIEHFVSSCNVDLLDDMYDDDV
eukprot:382883_1